MNNLLKAILSALFYFIVFILLPLLILNFQSLEPLKALNINQTLIESFTFTTIIVGLILIILSLIKNLSKNKLLCLIASILMILVGLYLVLYFFGFGNPLAFGISSQEIKLPEKPVTVMVTFNYSFIVMLSILIALLKIIKEVINFFS